MVFYNIQQHKWNNLTKDDEWPLARAYHRTVASKSSLFIIGGYTTDGLTNEILEYSLEKEVWNEIKCLQGKLFQACHSFGLIPITNQSLIILGGENNSEIRSFNTVTEITLENSNFLEENSVFILDSSNVNWNTVLFGKANNFKTSNSGENIEKEMYQDFEELGEQEF